MASISQQALLSAIASASGLGPSLDLTFRTSLSNASGATTFTFTAVAVGTAYTDRVVFVGVTGAGNTGVTVSSVTIGGVSATLGVQQAHSTSQSAVASLWAAVVPAGTTANVVVTWSTTQLRCGIGVWTANGIGSLTPVNTVTSQSDPATGTLTTVTGRPAFVVYYQRSNPSTVTWGTPFSTPDYSEIYASSRYQGGAGAVASGTSISVSVNPSSNDDHIMVAASYD